MNEIVARQTDRELGEIVFKRNLRSKRMSIKIFPEILEVNLPRGFSANDGMQFVDSVRERLLKKQKSTSKKSILISENNNLQTLTFIVQVKKSEREDIFSSLKSGILSIEYPNNLDVNTTNTQQYFWNSINYFLRKEAKRILPYRTHQLAQKHGFTFSDVKIQSSKTRWGSCNHKQAINLSFYLLLLPQHLVDYVILHELCHTKEMNHGPRFWALMDKVTDGKSKELRREKKNYFIPRF